MADVLTDFFGKDLLPPDVPQVQTPYASRQLVQESNSEELVKRKSEKESWGTDRGSGERVQTSGKAVSKEISRGGVSTHRNSQRSTNFVPSENSNDSKAADYFRTGLYTSVIKEIGGESVEVQEWSPVPELMAATSDDYNGVLASIRLIDPKKVKANDNGSQNRAQLVPEFSKFFLEGVSESHQEKVQIVETFNDFYAFFYGERPPVYTFSGHLLNLKNYNWLNEFMYYYQNFWRGTKAAELGARVFLTYNYQQIQGYVLGISTNLNAVTDKAAPFSLQVLVTKRLIFNGTDGDELIRDNLLPKSDTGFINTQASNFSKALVNAYLEGTRPASGLDIVTDSNADRGIRTVKDNASSTVKQPIPRAAVQEDDIVIDRTRGSKRANGLLSSLGGFFSF